MFCDGSFGDLGYLVMGPLVMGRYVMGHFEMGRFVMGRFETQVVYNIQHPRKRCQRFLIVPPYVSTYTMEDG
jgi:hypothetical protein